MKQINLRSAAPIDIDQSAFLGTINDLRKEYGSNKKGKAPIDLETALQKLKLFQSRDADSGMLSFRLHYEDADGIPCTRDFPNFGLDVKSESKLERGGDKLILTVDLTIKAGKPKWQSQEIAECAKILSDGNYKIALYVTLDETTEWAGHSSQVATGSDTPDTSAYEAMPAACFIADAK